MKTLCVGLDLGSRSFVLVVLDKESGAVLKRQTWATSEHNLLRAIEELPAGEVHVHLEASELAHWTWRTLKPRVARVVVTHPKSNAWIGQDPLKNDKRDAYKLAEMLRTMKLHEVFYSEEEGRAEFKRVVRHYEQTTREEASLKRGIKAELRKSGVIVHSTVLWSKEGREQTLQRVGGEVIRTLLKQRYELLDAALQAQKNAKKLMCSVAKRFPEVQLLQKMPGVGDVLACRTSAGLQTPHRFATKRQVIRYFRLGIAWRESDGKKLRHQALDPNGCGSLKDVTRKVFMAALRRREDNGIKRRYLETLRGTQDKVHARLTTQRKIAVALWAMWRDNKEYRDELMG